MRRDKLIILIEIPSYSLNHVAFNSDYLNHIIVDRGSDAQMHAVESLLLVILRSCDVVSDIHTLCGKPPGMTPPPPPRQESVTIATPTKYEVWLVEGAAGRYLRYHRRLTSAVSTLGQHFRWWPSVQTALVRCWISIPADTRRLPMLF